MIKYRYIGINKINDLGEVLEVNSYNGVKVKNGDIVEFDDYFAKKAEKNSNYELVKEKEIKEEPEEPEEPSEDERKDLEYKAFELGIRFRSNLSTEKLRERINSYLAL